MPRVPGTWIVAASVAFTIAACSTRNEALRWTAELPFPAVGTVAVDGERIVAFGWDGEDGEEVAGTLVAYDARTGAQLWRRDLTTRTLVEGLREPSPPPYVLVAEGIVCCRDASSRILVVEASDGSDRWTGPVSASVASVAGGAVRAIDSEGRLMTLDLATGTAVRTESLRSKPGAWRGDRVLVANGREFLSLDGPIAARDAATGRVLWTSPGTGSDVEMNLVGATLVASETGRIRGLDAASGREVWTIETSLDTVIRPPCVARGLLVTTRGMRSGEAIRVLDAATGADVRRLAGDVLVGGGGDLVLTASIRDHYAPLTKIWIELAWGVAWSDSLDWRLDARDPSTGDVVWSDDTWMWGYPGTPAFGASCVAVPHVAVRRSSAARLRVFPVAATAP